MALKGITSKTQKKLEELMEPEKEKGTIQAALKVPVKHDTDYADKRDEYLEAYLTQEPFEFNINTDKLYQQYADQYKRQANDAMKDTIANAAAKTGGYGSSYGVTAGAQAYQGYLDKLNQVVPELETLAYEKYSDKVNNSREKLDILDAYDNKEYDRYRDEVEDFKDARDHYRDIYEYESDADREMYQMMTNYILKLAQLENSDYHDLKDWELALAKLYSE